MPAINPLGPLSTLRISPMASISKGLRQSLDNYPWNDGCKYLFCFPVFQALGESPANIYVIYIVWHFDNLSTIMQVGIQNCPQNQNRIEAVNPLEILWYFRDDQSSWKKYKMCDSPALRKNTGKICEPSMSLCSIFFNHPYCMLFWVLHVVLQGFVQIRGNVRIIHCMSTLTNANVKGISVFHLLWPVAIIFSQRNKSTNWRLFNN